MNKVRDLRNPKCYVYKGTIVAPGTALHAAIEADDDEKASALYKEQLVQWKKNYGDWHPRQEMKLLREQWNVDAVL